MNKKSILIIFDQKAKPDNLLRLLNRINNQRISLCPITTDYILVEEFKNKIAAVNPTELKILNFPLIFNEIGPSLRETFIRFISDFSEINIGNKSLKKYFKFPFADFSIWWFSLIAEKNTLKTETYHNLAKLISVLEIAKQCQADEIWIDITSSGLTKAIKENLRKSGTAVIAINNLNNFFRLCKELFSSVLLFNLSLIKRIALCRLDLKDREKRIEKLKNSKYLAVTYFPFFDKKQAVRENRFTNRYYGPIQAALKESFKDSHSWITMTIEDRRFEDREVVEFANKINAGGDNLVMFEECFGFFDFLKNSLVYIYLVIKFFKARRQIKREFLFKGNYIIWPIFESDWLNSFCGKVLLESLYCYRVFNNVFSFLKDNTTVLYIAEMHAWEKVLAAAARNYKSLRTVALQHATVPRMLLHYFNTPQELNNSNSVEAMPIPKYLGCSGNFTYRIFSECGWIKKQLFFSGAIRYQHLRIALDSLAKKKENKIIVALTILPNESRELLYYIYQAFRGLRGFKILIKSHPDIPINSLVNDLGIVLDKNIFEITDKPLSRLLEDSRFMITTVSSAAVEAIAYGCYIISPLLSSYLNMNPLKGAYDEVQYISSPDELKNAVLRVGPLEDATRRKDFINKYFHFFDKESGFLERINSLN